MKTIPLLIAALLCLGATCKPEPAAAPTAKAASPVPAAIAEAHAKALAAIAAAEAKLAALELQAATAAAQIESARIANTNQPPSPATTVVDKEAGLALGNLPPPDVKAALEAEKRRAAIFAGQADEARKLYALAQTETERMKAEAARLKIESESAKVKAGEAQAALVAAEKSHAASLEKNRAENQAKLDAANKRADEAEEKAKNERHKLIFRALLGLGLACIAGAIAMAVLTNGVMLGKSLMLAGGGAVCIGVAQIVSHPWFDRIFGTCLGMALVGGIAYIWFERKDALKRATLEKQAQILDRVDLDTIPVKDEDGKDSTVKREFLRKMNDPEKAVVKQIRLAAKMKEAKAEAKA